MAGILALLVLAAGGIYLMAGLDHHEATLSGMAYAVDGDTLRIGGTRIRLLGMDAPELDQTCRDAGGADWACGSAAHRRLSALVAVAATHCAANGRDRYGRVLALCTTAAQDLGAVIVAEGLAVASGGYGREEAAARADRRGIWAGTFEPPESWRDRARGFDLWGFVSGLFG